MYNYIGPLITQMAERYSQCALPYPNERDYYPPQNDIKSFIFVKWRALFNPFGELDLYL